MIGRAVLSAVRHSKTSLPEVVLPAESRESAINFYLQRCLQGNSQELDLSHCVLCLCDMPLIEHTLTSSTAPICSLDFSGSLLTEDFVKEVLRVIRRCSDVRRVLFDENQGKFEAIEKIEQLTACRRIAVAETKKVWHEKQNQLLQAERDGAFFQSRTNLIIEESARRSRINNEQKCCWLEQLDFHTAVKERCERVEHKRTHTHARITQRLLLSQQEGMWRNQIHSLEHAERLLMAQAQFFLQRTVLISEQNEVRADIKVREKDDWVVTRRQEKRRYANEAFVRAEYCQLEESSRTSREREEKADRDELQRAETCARSVAKTSEGVRLERLQREEAARRRLEDLVRERAEKEEALRQKALREVLMKQQQAREKLESDSMVARKSIRHIENAMFNAVQRLGSLLFQHLAMRSVLFAAGEAYDEIVLQSLPEVHFNVEKKVVHSFFVNESEPLHLFKEPLGSRRFSFAMPCDWESRAREAQNDFVVKLQKVENSRTALRQKRMEELRVLKGAMLQHRTDQIRVRALTSGVPATTHRLSQSSASFASFPTIGELSLTADVNDSSSFFSNLQSPCVGDQFDIMLQQLFSFGSQNSYFINELDNFVSFPISTGGSEAPIRVIRQLKLAPHSGFVKVFLQDSASSDIKETLLFDTAVAKKLSIAVPAPSELPDSSKISFLQSDGSANIDPFELRMSIQDFAISPLDVELAVQRLKPEYHLRHVCANDQGTVKIPWIYNEEVLNRLAEFSRLKPIDPQPLVIEPHHSLRLASSPEILMLLTKSGGDLENLSDHFSQLIESLRYFASTEIPDESDSESCQGWLRTVRFQCHIIVDQSCWSDNVSEWLAVRKRILDSARIVCSSPSFPEAKPRIPCATLEATGALQIATLRNRRGHRAPVRPVGVTSLDIPTVECPFPQLPPAFPRFACTAGAPTLVFDSDRQLTGLDITDRMPFTGYELHFAIRQKPQPEASGKLQFYFLSERGTAWIGPGENERNCVFYGEEGDSMTAEVISGQLQQYGSGFSTFQKRASVTKKSRSVSRAYSLAVASTSSISSTEDLPRDHVVLRLVGQSCTASVIDDIVRRTRLGLCPLAATTPSSTSQLHMFECVCYLVPPLSPEWISSQQGNAAVDPFRRFSDDETQEVNVTDNKSDKPLELVLPRDCQWLCSARTAVVLISLPPSSGSTPFTPRSQPVDIRAASAKMAATGVLFLDNSRQEKTRRFLSNDDPDAWIAAPFECVNIGAVDPRDSLIEAFHEVDAEIEICVSLEKADSCTSNDQSAPATPPLLSPRAEKPLGACVTFNPAVSVVEGVPLFSIGGVGQTIEVNTTLFEQQLSVGGLSEGRSGEGGGSVDMSPRGADESGNPIIGQLTAGLGSLTLTLKLAAVARRLPRQSREGLGVRFIYIMLLEKLLQAIRISGSLATEDSHDVFLKMTASAMLLPPADTPQPKPAGRGKVKEVPFSTVLLGRKKVSTTSTDQPMLPGSSSRPSVLSTTSSDLLSTQVTTFPAPFVPSLGARTVGKVILFPFASQGSEISTLVEQVLHFRHHWRVHEPSLRSAVIQIALTAPAQATHQVTLVDQHFSPTLCAFPSTMTSVDSIALETLVAHDRSSPLYRAWSGNLTSPRRKEAEAKVMQPLQQDATLVFHVDRLLALLAESADNCDEVDKQRVVDFIISCCCRFVLLASPATAKSACSVTLRVGYTDRSIRVYASHTVCWDSAGDQCAAFSRRRHTHFTSNTIQAVALSANTRKVRGRCMLVFSTPTPGENSMLCLRWPEHIVGPAKDLLFVTSASGQVKLFRIRASGKDQADNENEEIAIFTTRSDSIEFELIPEAEHAVEYVATALNAMSRAAAPTGACWRVELLGSTESADYDSHLLAVARNAVAVSVASVCRNEPIFPSLPCGVVVDGTSDQVEESLIQLCFSPVELPWKSLGTKVDGSLPWGTISHVASDVTCADSIQLTRSNDLPRANLFLKSILVAYVTYTAESKTGGIAPREIPLQLLLNLMLNMLNDHRSCAAL